MRGNKKRAGSFHCQPILWLIANGHFARPLLPASTMITAVRFAATVVISTTVVSATSGFRSAISITRAMAAHAAIAIIAASIAVIVATEPTRFIESTSPIISAIAIKPTVVVVTRSVKTPVPAIMIEPLAAERLAWCEPLFRTEMFKPWPEAKAVYIKRTIVRGMRVIKVVPGTSADEHAIHEPVRPVIAIRSAAKRICRIEPVLADRRCVVKPVGRAYLHPNRYLCLGMHAGERQYCHQ